MGYILNENGEIAVEGEGTYLKMNIEDIADFDHQAEEWMVISEPEDPDFFELIE